MESDLIFLQTHIDYYPNTLSLQKTYPVLTIWGNTMDLKPIRVQVEGYLPYFYIKQSKRHNLNQSKNEKNTKQTNYNFDSNMLEEAIKTKFKEGKCMGVEKVMKMSIYGFTEENTDFYKVYFDNPACFRAAKLFFEQGFLIDSINYSFNTFENNFSFVLRFMNDLKLSGMSYLKIKNYTEISNNPRTIKTSVEFVEQLPFEGEYNKILPLSIFSFDIECCSPTSGFPDAQKDPVIQIGNIVVKFGDDKLNKTIFCLKETAQIPDANVIWFDDEVQLLTAWRNFLLENDPDIVLGYNIKGFDFQYILDRAQKLKIKDYGMLGRGDRISKVVSKQQSSKMFGTFDSKDITIDGRLIFDLFHVIRRDYKLRSYSLNSVSAHFLNEQKEDVPPTSMYALQNESKVTRARIASYCLKDSYLTFKIFEKLNILINYSELSRATYVPIDMFSTRGAAIKVLTQIYREASLSGYLIPDYDVQESAAEFEGGFVMDPLRGFYSDPIAVLDFTSLYPSIMISKNLCYSTLLSKDQFNQIGGTKSPTNNYFCTIDTKEGVLPRILKKLLKARSDTKKKLKEENDPLLKRALDGRQLALKICANSLYGFTGAANGQLPCVEISQSTTSFGRDMIVLTKKLIEENFCKRVGFTHDAQVIYGDTDSVMINFFEKDINKVFDISRQVSKFVSDRFEKPVSLEFEKVYNPYLLINKKRYAGLIYTNPSKPDKIDTKGIETVRRDNCELVKTVVESCLHKIMYQKDLEGAKDIVRNIIQDLYQDKIDLSQLVISKTFTKSNYTSKQAHTELAEKLKTRGVSVAIGDRVPYVIVKGDKHMAAYEKSEDPVYVLENNLPIDKEYYIEQQIYKPVQRLFESIEDNISSMFHGEHTKIITKNVGMQGPMNIFVKTSDECIGCKKAGMILCTACQSRFPHLLFDIRKNYSDKAKLFNLCWTECQRCQGSLVNEVLCVNRVCPIFYKRTKVKKEITAITEKLNKLKNLSW